MENPMRKKSVLEEIKEQVANNKENKEIDKTNINNKVDSNNNVGRNFVDTVTNKEINLSSIIRPSKAKEERSMIAVNLKKDVADKVKAYAYNNQLTVTEVLEDVIFAMFGSVELDEVALAAYEEKYRKKNEKKRSKKK